MTAYVANLKQNTTEAILLLDKSTNKIKELSRGMDVEALKKIAHGIWDELKNKHPQFLESLPAISKDNFELIPALKFTYAAIPLLAKQRDIDSSALSVYAKLNEAKSLIAAGDEPIKKFELAKCLDFLSKSEEALNDLKWKYEPVYEQLQEVKNVREQIGRFKQDLQELVFSLIKQIVQFSENEIRLFESIPVPHPRFRHQ
eukprot:TRINITY_DN7828_c0_g1_i1.p2 TRINITY_DN7828_c0_g1~~TRINITY_DN7828_c0_g1_i1.p2  ORF type:complete len:201 (-),score=61.05 TRINITY_DN7828_c0_g1_i1:1642-2244(-)